MGPGIGGIFEKIRFWSNLRQEGLYDACTSVTLLGQQVAAEPR